ncbi:hypothetical protein [Reyranella sp.]|uniref:hypothetical protein n=1 Tax=Reyranella sp. TaxID=1929291 RepID=UPI003D113574
MVEDNFLVAEVMCDLLRGEGCVVVGPASRLERGLCLARDAELDSALLDINLNGERCFAIAELLSRRHVPFIFLTGYDEGSIVPPRCAAPRFSASRSAISRFLRPWARCSLTLERRKTIACPAQRGAVGVGRVGHEDAEGTIPTAGVTRGQQRTASRRRTPPRWTSQR